jgi:hypothetical protein
MNHRAKSFLALALMTGSLMLAPAAQAAEINRNTGVGLQIAAQGNAALRYIESALHLAQPKLPKPHATKVSVPAPAAPGGAILSTAGVNCAE